MVLRLPRVQNGSGGSSKLRFSQVVALEAAGSNPVIHPISPISHRRAVAARGLLLPPSR